MDPKDIFNKAYDILVEHAGASNLDHYREAFVEYFVTERHTTEWRFLGNLGFGGKFWRNDERYYILCYSEDKSPERDKVIEKVNALLKELPYFSPPWKAKS